MTIKYPADKPDSYWLARFPDAPHGEYETWLKIHCRCTACVAARGVVNALYEKARRQETNPGTEWQDHAACKGKDPDIFVLPLDTPKDEIKSREDRAKRICATCPVIQQCLDHAIFHNEPNGVWGGQSPRTRMTTRRRRRESRMRELTCQRDSENDRQVA